MAAEVACHDEYDGLEDLHGGALEGGACVPRRSRKGVFYIVLEWKSNQKPRCRDSTCVAESTGANHYMQGNPCKGQGNN